MNIDYKLVGERIKRARKSKGITQENMAERLNVSIGYVSQVERGVTKISLDLLVAISIILECDIAAFCKLLLSYCRIIGCRLAHSRPNPGILLRRRVSLLSYLSGDR